MVETHRGLRDRDIDTTRQSASEIQQFGTKGQLEE